MAHTNIRLPVEAADKLRRLTLDVSSRVGRRLTLGEMVEQLSDLGHAEIDRLAENSTREAS